jgi:uncharacterized protein with NAD-binding domain and iron-sulfur cluster
MAYLAQKKRVAVVGGGIAGLTTAWALLDRGFEVSLFEERIHLGGKMGGHPARVPLWQLLASSKEQDLHKSAGEFLDAKTTSFRQGLDERFAQAMRSRVPPFVLRVIDLHFERLCRQLGPTFSERFLQLREAARDAEPISVIHLHRQRGVVGPRDAWRVTLALPVVRRKEPLEVAFDVAIHERVDGRMTLELTDTAFHEHCYHMFLNWYGNFWSFMEEIGLERGKDFIDHREVVHLSPGLGPPAPRSSTMASLGDIARSADNLLSGAAPLPDLFLWLYSMLDLVSRSFDPERYLDRRSVHAFLASRWYATDESVRFHEHLLAKAFAVPTYFSSAYTYRQYVEYTMAAPDPMLWVLRGNAQEHLFARLQKRLQDKGLRLNLGLQVVGISDPTQGPVRLKVRPSDVRGVPRDPDTGRRPGDDGETPAEGGGSTGMSFEKADFVVLAVPPAALARITGDFRERVPGLATVRKLQSAVTAALDLYFVDRIPGIPAHHVVLRGSALGLTLIDNSQVWREEQGGPTHLNVAVTDFYKIDGMGKPEAMRAILEDLHRFIDFDDAQVDFTRTYLQMNNGEPLFVNEVGSEPWRPGTCTEMPNLFLAGDFCDNDIGIVSVEGAVVSGLLAARAVQAQVRAHEPNAPADDPRFREVPIQLPDIPDPAQVDALKTLLLPQVAMAYAASKLGEWSRHPERALSQRDLQLYLEQALQAMVAPPAQAAALAARALQSAAALHARGRR